MSTWKQQFKNSSGGWWLWGLWMKNVPQESVGVWMNNRMNHQSCDYTPWRRIINTVVFNINAFLTYLIFNGKEQNCTGMASPYQRKIPRHCRHGEGLFSPHRTLWGKSVDVGRKRYDVGKRRNPCICIYRWKHVLSYSVNNSNRAHVAVWIRTIVKQDFWLLGVDCGPTVGVVDKTPLTLKYHQLRKSCTVPQV